MKALITRHWRTLRACRTKLHVAALYTALAAAHNQPDRVLDLTRQFLLNVPTLQEVLQHCPLWLGLNIEIKYPIEPDVEYLSYTPPFEINAYLDAILEVVFEFAGPRRIILTCFHPGTCGTTHTFLMLLSGWNEVECMHVLQMW